MPPAELAHIIAVCTFGASLQKVHIRLCPIKALPIEPMQFCVAHHKKLRIRLHPSYESICGKQREKSEDHDCNSLYEIDGICRQLR